MAIILHKNISDGERHNPKGFEGANFGDYFWKNEEGELEYIDELVLPSALNFVDASVAPPTTNTGDIYVLSSGGSVDAGWGTASLGDWVRYNGTEYKAITPQKSTLCYNENDDTLYSYDGTNWNTLGGGNISDSDLTFDANHYADLSTFSWTLGGTAPIGTEKISFQKDTLIKGSDTSSSTSGFKFVDSTNSSLWDFRNNGNIHQGKNSSLLLNGYSLLFDASTASASTPFEVRTAKFGGTGLDPYFKISTYGAIETLTRSGDFFKLKNSAGTDKFIFRDGEFKSIGNVLEFSSSFITTKMTAGAWEYYNSGGTLIHSIMTALSPKVTFSRTGVASIPFIVGNTANILTEKITFDGNTLTRGTNTSSATVGFQHVDSANSPKFEVRNNGDIYTNGVQGFSGTGSYTNFTITNGIITSAS